MDVKNKKVLITGGAGFIGANFVYKFLELGASVTVAERKSANLWRIKNAGVAIKTIDLSNATDVKALIRKVRPDIVLHFATYGAYQRFQQDINLTIDTNLKGTINLINACQKIGVQAFINTGTNSEYGIKERPMKETDVLEPENLYGITKGAATMYCQMIARQTGFPAVTIRPFAAYGYFEEKERLVPSVVMGCLQNRPIHLSQPKIARPFMFIEDVINAYILAIENISKIKGQIINIGLKRPFTIEEVVTVAKKITKAKTMPQYGKIRLAQPEAQTWAHDISKAKKLLGWQPRYTLEQGLKKTIAWFEKNLSLYEKE